MLFLSWAFKVNELNVILRCGGKFHIRVHYVTTAGCTICLHMYCVVFLSNRFAVCMYSHIFHASHLCACAYSICYQVELNCARHSHIWLWKQSFSFLSAGKNTFKVKWTCWSRHHGTPLASAFILFLIFSLQLFSLNWCWAVCYESGLSNRLP